VPHARSVLGIRLDIQQKTRQYSTFKRLLKRTDVCDAHWNNPVRRRRALKQSFHWPQPLQQAAIPGCAGAGTEGTGAGAGPRQVPVIHFQSTRTFTEDDTIQGPAYYPRKKYISGSTRQRTSPRCIPPCEVADSEAGIASSNNTLPPERGG
jgi:hypothetical protein